MDRQEDVGSSATIPIERLVSKNLDKIAEQSRALVVVAAIVAIAAVGLAVAVDDIAGRIAGLSVFLLLMLVITVLLYLTSRASTYGGEKANPAAVANALSTVNGTWWQLVVNQQTPGLSVIRIDLSTFPNRHHLSGTKFTRDGTEMARWKSRAVGLMSVEPVEVFYYWQGSYSGHAGTTSGIGYFEFPMRVNAGVDTGTGWFTTGDVEAGDFSSISKVHLRRMNSADQELIAQAGEARQARLRTEYECWVSELGL